MKKIILILGAMAMILIFAVASVGAAPTSYTSCFAIQNLDSANLATINIQFLSQTSGSTPIDVPDTIPANGSKAYCPLSSVSVGFNGSAVISSDKEVAAIVNVSGDSAFSSYNASYSSFTGGANTVSLPALFDNNFGFNTWYNVQNTGGSNATVNVNYSDGTTAGPVTIEPGRSHTFDQIAETHSQAVFAASVSSTQPIVATVMEVGPSGAPMLFGYSGFGQSSTNPVMPLVLMNQYNYTSAIQIQNTHPSNSSSVTVTYTPSTALANCQGGFCGTSCTETHTIAAGASETFALNGCIKSQSTFVGSARVTANSNNVGLVAIVNQHDLGTAKGSSYSAFNPADATDTVVLPAIFDRNYGYNTGFNVMNVGGGNVQVNCTFSNTPYSVSQNLAPGAVLTDVQQNKIANLYVGSATCTAPGGLIVAVVNETRLGGTKDTFLTYEGTNK